MNVTDTPLRATLIRASTPSSRRLSIAFDSQPERAVPLRHHLHTDLAEPHEATEPELVLLFEEPIPYSHWGIND